jgi:enamine deaminase RidA (YjgF/YER057c/UK114 family)
MIQHLNPDGLHKNPAYSQAIVVSGEARTIYVGGQNAVDKDGNVVGLGDLFAQTTQAVANMKTALEAAGAGFEHLVKMTIYLVAPQDVRPGYEAWMKAAGPLAKPPTISVLKVAGLGHQDWLVEIDAVAVVPGGGA